jgi:hypothetical protein
VGEILAVVAVVVLAVLAGMAVLELRRLREAAEKTLNRLEQSLGKVERTADAVYHRQTGRQASVKRRNGQDRQMQLVFDDGQPTQVRRLRRVGGSKGADEE